MNDPSTNNPAAGNAAANTARANGPGADKVVENGHSVEQQRAELAETVGELRNRLDVPARASQTAGESVEAVRRRPQIPIAVVGVLGVIVAVVIWRRRRN